MKKRQNIYTIVALISILAAGIFNYIWQVTGVTAAEVVSVVSAAVCLWAITSCFYIIQVSRHILRTNG